MCLAKKEFKKSVGAVDFGVLIKALYGLDGVLKGTPWWTALKLRLAALLWSALSC